MRSTTDLKNNQTSIFALQKNLRQLEHNVVHLLDRFQRDCHQTDMQAASQLLGRLMLQRLRLVESTFNKQSGTLAESSRAISELRLEVRRLRHGEKTCPCNPSRFIPIKHFSI